MPVTRVVGTEQDARAAAIAAEFDEKAAGYEAGRLGPWYRAQASLVLKHLGGVQGTLLDVGCGTGWLIRRYLEATPGGRAVGVDLSSGMIAEARERAGVANLSGARFVIGDWENPETEDRVRSLLPERAGAVVCVSTFHYFREPVMALGRMLRLLAPGGRLLLLERSRDRSPMTTLWDLLHRTVIRDHVRFYRERELLSLLGGAGFSQPRTVARVREWAWKGKLFTSLVLLEAHAGRGAATPAPPKLDALK
jgi:ubiquinone/menaquinone biosynthesis C-methylase UbiE